MKPRRRYKPGFAATAPITTAARVCGGITNPESGRRSHGPGCHPLAPPMCKPRPVDAAYLILSPSASFAYCGRTSSNTARAAMDSRGRAVTAGCPVFTGMPETDLPAPFGHAKGPAPPPPHPANEPTITTETAPRTAKRLHTEAKLQPGSPRDKLGGHSGTLAQASVATSRGSGVRAVRPWRFELAWGRQDLRPVGV
jgi:hypothetical protein